MRRSNLYVLIISVALAASCTAARVHLGSLGGAILQRNGKPAAGAEVILERSDGSEPLATQTNAEGRFVFKFIRPGLYDVRASKGDSATVWRHNLLVHSGRETVIELRLQPLSAEKQKPSK